MEHVCWGRGRRMEEDGGGCGDDVNNACITYNDDRANENATKALPEGGVQGGGNFRTQSTIKLELGVERGGADVQMTMTTTMRPREKKITPTNHKQWEDASGNRGGERSR